MTVWSCLLSMPAAKYDYPVEKTCPICYSTWEATTSKQVENKETCSPACAGAMKAWTQRGVSKNQPSKPPEDREGLVEVTCANCGETKWERQDRADGNNFCDGSCYGEWESANEATREHLKEIAATGADGWTAESLESFREKMTGENNPSWKGGVTKKKRKGNYKQEIMVRCPPEFSAMARANGYVPEHRLAVARELGRSLTSEECVHHIDHDNHNNDLENLELYPNNKTHKLAEGDREKYVSERLWPEPPE